MAQRGMTRGEIAKVLGVRYQLVRQVFLRYGIEGGLRSSNEKNNISAAAPKNNAEKISWEFLLKAGFQYIGEWFLREDAIYLDGDAFRNSGVYAMTLNDNIVYIGLSLSGLHKRMKNYESGYTAQRTSARIKSLIIDSLREGHRVKVLMIAPAVTQWNGLPINTAAGLEAGLIEMLKPVWNIQGVSK